MVAGAKSWEGKLEMAGQFYLQSSLQWHTYSSKYPPPKLPYRQYWLGTRCSDSWDYPIVSQMVLIPATTRKLVHLKCCKMPRCFHFWFWGNSWHFLSSIGECRYLDCLATLWLWFPPLLFQYDTMGKNQTAVREEMIRLANYLDSVSCISLWAAHAHSLGQNLKLWPPDVYMFVL